MLSKLTSQQISDISQRCHAFRIAIELTDKNLLPITLRNFPNGACGDAALLLAKYLQTDGYGGFNYVLGQRGEQSHAWLQRGDVVVDITADQFSDKDDKVIVASNSDWHNQFNGEVQHEADFILYDDSTAAVLQHAYVTVIEQIAKIEDSSVK